MKGGNKVKKYLTLFTKKLHNSLGHCGGGGHCK